MMMHAMGSSKSIAMILIAMGVGYFVCVKAEKEKGFLKQLGYWIGSIIIIASVISALSGWYCKMVKKCGFMSCKGKVCSPCGPMKQMKKY